MKKMFNEGNQIHNLITSSGSGAVINYGSGSDFLTSYGSGSTSQKVMVPPVPVPVPQHWLQIRDSGCPFDPWIRDEHPGPYFQELTNNFFGLKILKFFDADPRSFLTLDPGWKNSDPG
jgi:hypothetical protein